MKKRKSDPLIYVGADKKKLIYVGEEYLVLKFFFKALMHQLFYR